MKKTILLSTILIASLSAKTLTHSVSNQGYTGVMNTPNAQVMNEGDLTLHFDNQFNNSLRAYDENKKYSYSENYLISMGLLPNLEMQLRLSEVPHYHRDLSANIKYKIPYTHKYLPNLALGYQDLGSAANNFGNYYGVLDKEVSFIRASIGYGHSTVENEKRRRMDGLFYALEVETTPWLYLLAENDSVESFAGIRLKMPKSWSDTIKFNTLLTTNLENTEDYSLSFNLTFALYDDTTHYVPKKSSENIFTNLYKKENKVQEQLTFSKKKNDIYSLVSLEKKLIELGLENITISYKSESIYLSYENNVFSHNDLDALGVVIGSLTQTKYKYFIVEQKRSKVTTLCLSGDLQKAKLFFENPNTITKEDFARSLKKSDAKELKNYTYFTKSSNDSFMKLKVELAPQIITFVGTEFGAFNYKLWLRTKLITNLYKGIDFSFVGDLNVNDSEIDDKRYEWFVKLYEKKSHIESLMLHGSVNLFDGINTTSIGSFEENYLGILNQYINNIGNHTFKLKVGYFQQFQDGNSYVENYLGKFDTRDFYLAKYSYMLSDYDISAELNFGKYWNQDTGFDMKIKRFFGDTAMYVTYNQSKANSIFSEQTNKVVGLGIEIPLTPKHNYNGKFQVKGTNAFNYHLKTTVLRGDGTNNIVPGGNYDPYVALSSEEYFLNRNRLQILYIKKHLFSLVDSYTEYK